MTLKVSTLIQHGLLLPLWLGWVVSAPATLSAQDVEPRSEERISESRRVNVRTFVSGSYSYNFNSPADGLNGLRVFDFDDNDFKVDVAEVVLQLPAAEPNDGGFRLDATLGASIPRITASRGLFRNADGSAEDIDLQQAYVSYIASIGEGLRIDFGKFVTPTGMEVIDGYDGYNDNATRSILFGYAIPFTHTGLRLGYTASPQFAASMMLVNGWDVMKDNNRAKSAGAQITLAPAEELSLLLTYIGGAERDSNNTDLRHLADLVATWKIGDRFTVGVNGDYGTEANAVAAGKNAVWQGIAAYLKLTLAETFTLALRGEVFEDRDGARTGTPQTLKELTLTPQYNPTPNVAFRADLRIDFSTAEAFDKEGAASSRQPTLLLNAIFAY